MWQITVVFEYIVQCGCQGASHKFSSQEYVQGQTVIVVYKFWLLEICIAVYMTFSCKC